jgi:hypothetical protein
MTKWQPSYDENDFVQYHPMFAPIELTGRLLLVTKISTVWLGLRRTVRVRATFADTGESVNVMAGVLIGPESPLWIDDSPAKVAADSQVWREHPLDLDQLFGKDNGPPPF